METTFHEVYYDVEKAIDYAFKGKYVMRFYEYLKVKGTLKREIKEFIQSQTASNINELIMDLDSYLEGGADNQHKQLREAYGHLSKPEARKIRNYLYGILEDAWKYENDKKRRSRKKKTK